MHASFEAQLAVLIAERWSSIEEARAWLTDLIARRKWSAAEVHKKGFSLSSRSRLCQVQPNSTARRVERFLEGGGPCIPPWLYWVVLADEYEDVPEIDRWEWEWNNIPENPDNDEPFY